MSSASTQIDRSIGELRSIMRRRLDKRWPTYAANHPVLAEQINFDVLVNTAADMLGDRLTKKPDALASVEADRLDAQILPIHAGEPPE